MFVEYGPGAQGLKPCPSTTTGLCSLLQSSADYYANATAQALLDRNARGIVFMADQNTGRTPLYAERVKMTDADLASYHFDMIVTGGDPANDVIVYTGPIVCMYGTDPQTLLCKPGPGSTPSAPGVYTPDEYSCANANSPTVKPVVSAPSVTLGHSVLDPIADDYMVTTLDSLYYCTQFQNTSNEPVAGVRRVDVTITQTQSTGSTNFTVNVHSRVLVIPTNDQPALCDNSTATPCATTITYTEHAAAGCGGSIPSANANPGPDRDVSFLALVPSATITDDSTKAQKVVFTFESGYAQGQDLLTCSGDASLRPNSGDFDPTSRGRASRTSGTRASTSTTRRARALPRSAPPPSSRPACSATSYLAAAPRTRTSWTRRGRTFPSTWTT